MEFQDYYKTLGVEKTASADEIKKAYRKLARKYHPDVSKEINAEKKMQTINEANTVLSDPEKRAAYDQLGQGYQSGQDFQAPPNWDAGFEFSGSNFNDQRFNDESDFFANLFGHTGKRHSSKQHQARGEDHHAKIIIDLVDAYHGTTRNITLRSPNIAGNEQSVNKERVISVQIPKGVKTGQHIRLSGQGSPGYGGAAPGDLYLEIQFSDDLRYRVDGRDVHQTVPVTPWEAALGGSIEITTPSGVMQVKIPENSQTGRKLRLKARGIPGEPPGDLYLLLEVVLPLANNDKARQIYTTMANELAFNPRAGA